MYMKETEDKKVIIVRLSDRLCERFDEIIDNLGLNRSEVVRMLMNEYVDKNTK